MQILSIPYSEDILIATGSTPKQLEQEFRLLLAAKLFEVGRLSLGKAAEIAGLPKPRFMDDLGRLGVPIINLDDDQIADELRDD
jgi:predicted HTH domain antitoxin